MPLERKEFGSRSGQTFCSSVGPDLGPNSLQRLTAEDQSCRWKGKSIDPDQDRRSAALSVLIWVHTVCKGYQQRTKVAAAKERDWIQIMTDILWVLIWVRKVIRRRTKYATGKESVCLFDLILYVPSTIFQL